MERRLLPVVWQFSEARRISRPGANSFSALRLVCGPVAVSPAALPRVRPAGPSASRLPPRRRRTKQVAGGNLRGVPAIRQDGIDAHAPVTAATVGDRRGND